MFHPAVAAWFDRSFAAPTAAQAQAWPAFQAGRHVLIAAPTGSGKTLAAFLAAIDALVRQGLQGELPDETQIVYVSPLKALSNDINRNLEAPLAGIREALQEQGDELRDLRGQRVEAAPQGVDVGLSAPDQVGQHVRSDRPALSGGDLWCGGP